MDENTFEELLKLQLAEPAGRTPFCPEDQQVAEYFDGVLPAYELGAFERHLADCSHCLARVGMLQRLEDERSPQRVPEDALASAKALRYGLGRRWGINPAWIAAAAVLVMAVAATKLLPLMEIGQDALPRAHLAEPGSELRQTRSFESPSSGPRFLAPADGSPYAPADHRFKWTAVPGSLYYQLRIVSEEGDLLWQGRISGTEWTIPEGVALVPGVDYFVRVDAYITDAKALQSDYLLFRLEGPG
jgi:hypothetical protein